MRRRVVTYGLELMKRITKYLIRVAIASLAFIAGVALFLFAPNPFSRIGTAPSASPVTFVPSELNKGKQCQPSTVYVRKKLDLVDAEVIDPRCTKLQLDLVSAAGTGKVDVIRALIVQGANPRASAVDESLNIQRALPSAVRSRQRESVQQLLDNGGDVNDSDSCCMTSESLLMIAVANHDIEMARLLLRRGADSGFRGIGDQTAFDMAAQYGQHEIVQMMDSAGGLSATQRAQARLARFLGLDIKAVHSEFIRRNQAKVDYKVYF